MCDLVAKESQMDCLQRTNDVGKMSQAIPCRATEIRTANAANSENRPPNSLETPAIQQGYDVTTDDFRMYCFKIVPCQVDKPHDWTLCPFAHPEEKANRRDPRLFSYSPHFCQGMRKNGCVNGNSCDYSHSVFETWLHPLRYRTQLCTKGADCDRDVCFFAHSAEQLRAVVPRCEHFARWQPKFSTHHPQSHNTQHPQRSISVDRVVSPPPSTGDAPHQQRLVSPSPPSSNKSVTGHYSTRITFDSRRCKQSHQQTLTSSRPLELSAMPTPVHLEGYWLSPSHGPAELQQQQELNFKGYHSEVAAASAAAFGTPVKIPSDASSWSGSIWGATTPVDKGAEEEGGGARGSGSPPPTALYLPLLPCSPAAYSLFPSPDAYDAGVEEVWARRSNRLTGWSAGWDDVSRACVVPV